jgi:hypothetical protein
MLSASKTVEGRKDLQSFSKHCRTPITRVTMRPVSGLAILSLNPSLQMKLTDDYAALRSGEQTVCRHAVQPNHRRPRANANVPVPHEII